MPTPFAVTVDTEEEWDWSSGYPTGPTRTENIHRLPDFQAACERHGAAVTYFVNRAVLDAPAARAVIVKLAQRPRVEIGMHIHPWNTPPLQPVEKVPVRDSFLHNLPPELALAKLNAVYTSFRDSGLAPVSFRGGRYSTSPWIQEWLRTAALSRTARCCHSRPGKTRAHRTTTRAIPSRCECRGRRRYGNCRSAWRSRACPFAFWNRVLATAERPPWRYLHTVGIMQKLGIFRKSWLNYENPFWDGMRQLVRVLQRANVPYLCFTVHSSSLLPGGSPYAATAADVDRIFSRIHDSLQFLSGDATFKPATIVEIARALEAEHARHRDQPAR